MASAFTIVPRDKFGNHVGLGHPSAFTVTGSPGTTLIGAMRDNGDGSYSVAGLVDPPSREPGIVLGRPALGAVKRPPRPGASPSNRK